MDASHLLCSQPCSQAQDDLAIVVQTLQWQLRNFEDVTYKRMETILNSVANLESQQMRILKWIQSADKHGFHNIFAGNHGQPAEPLASQPNPQDMYHQSLFLVKPFDNVDTFKDLKDIKDSISSLKHHDHIRPSANLHAELEKFSCPRYYDTVKCGGGTPTEKWLQTNPLNDDTHLQQEPLPLGPETEMASSPTGLAMLLREIDQGRLEQAPLHMKNGGGEQMDQMEERVSNSSYFTTNGAGSSNTLMLKNIPCRVSEQDVVSLIQRIGFGEQFEFCHIPARKNKGGNLGYAFVCFESEEVARNFAEKIVGMRFPDSNSKKTLDVAPARIQGLQTTPQCVMKI